MLNNYRNSEKSYKIVIKSTGKVIEFYRLKTTAMNDLIKLQKDYEEELEIRRNHG